MFKELHPLIQNRPLTITVAAMGGRRVRVNVIPQTLDGDSKVNDKINHFNKDKIAKVPDSAITALTTPLSLTGLPEEVDTETATDFDVVCPNRTSNCKRLWSRPRRRLPTR